MTGRNILLAFLLSLILTFSALAVYIFYPLIPAIFSNRESGIRSAGGNLSILLIIEPVLFIVIFAMLQRKSRKS